MSITTDHREPSRGNRRKVTALELMTALLLAVMASGCEGDRRPRESPAPTRASGEEPAMPEQPWKEPPLVHGPRIAPGPELESWLIAQRDERSQPRLVRLPATVLLDRGRSSVAGARLGIDPANDAMAVTLDDSALGVSLVDRTRSACLEDPYCALWLDGTWQGASPGERSLKVLHVGPAVTQAERSAPLYALVAVAEDSRPDLVSALDQLGGDAAIETKREAARTLVAAGKDAVPLLIASLGDGRAYETRDVVNRMNLPPGQTPDPVIGTVTVAMRAEDLLYEIITPAGTSADAGNFKVFSEQILSIPDWQSFWRAHRAQSLAEIHALLAPAVDRYWAEHGTTQIVR